nr:hypothetical protein [Tanacetum cinerariifolium]GEX60362.1 hypothetical protein [Tanacetum cinerariifolium]
MDEPNITMEEYIQLMADKSRGRDQMFNWEIAMCSEVYCKDLDSFTDFETDFSVIVYNDASTSNQNVSSEQTVSICNAIKSDIDFHISFFDSEDEDYTFIYNKDSSSYKLFPVNDLEQELVNDYVEINTESRSKNTDVKPMDSVICISKDTIPIEFNKNTETNHDTPEIELHLFSYLIMEPSEEVNNVDGCAGDVVDFRTWPGISLETAMISTMDLDEGTSSTDKILGLNQIAYMS